MNKLLEAALKYYKEGLSVIPTDALKQPLVRWKDFQSRLATESELRQMFNNTAATGIGLITGAISKNLEAIDIDTKYDLTSSLMKNLFAKIKSENPHLAQKLLVTQTRTKGYHLIYRCNEISRNTALAKRPTTEEEKVRNPKEKCKVLIETRGEGGYIIIAPTPGYKIVQGKITDIPSIISQEREALFTICKSFNTYTQQPLLRKSSTRAFADAPARGLSPFDDYNLRGDLDKLLQDHGWTLIKKDVTRTFYRRPGDTDKLISANYNHELGLFSVFSTSTEFEPNRGYRPYAVYAVLECNGNFIKALKKLAGEGYGQKQIAKINYNAITRRM